MSGSRPRGLHGKCVLTVALPLVMAWAALPATADVFGVAHRGGRVQGPENTLEVMQLTMQLGIHPWLETDSWLSKDGVPVLHHDRDLCRTTDIETFGFDCDNPSNNPLGRLPEVRDFTLAELKQLDVGEWFGPEWVGTRMPTLEEALLLLKDTGFRLLVQINSNGQAPIVKDILESNDIPVETMILWARSREFDVWKSVIPDIHQVTGQFLSATVDESLIASRAAAGDFGIVITNPGLTRELVDLVHSYGLLLYTIPDGVGFDPLLHQIDIGVDALHLANELTWQSLLSMLPCIDRIDNDSDGFFDADGVDLDFDFDRVNELPPDAQCLGRLDASEVPQCRDGVDNDGDGDIDAADAGCTDPEDISEAPIPLVPSSSGIGLAVLTLALAGLGAARLRAPPRLL